MHAEAAWDPEIINLAWDDSTRLMIVDLQTISHAKVGSRLGQPESHQDITGTHPLLSFGVQMLIIQFYF